MVGPVTPKEIWSDHEWSIFNDFIDRSSTSSSTEVTNTNLHSWIKNLHSQSLSAATFWGHTHGLNVFDFQLLNLLNIPHLTRTGSESGLNVFVI